MADVKLSKLATKRLPSATSLSGGTYANDVVSAVFANQSAGALTAGVWKEVLNVSTPGVLLGAAVRNGGGTSKTVGIRVTIDGVIAGTFEMPSALSAAMAGAWAGMAWISTSATPVAVFGWAPFQTLKVEVRSNINTSEPMYGVHYTGLEV